MNPPFFDHQELEELIAADALDGLDEGDRRRLHDEMRRHGEDCPECRRLIEEYSEVAAHLAASVDPVPMSALAERRLFAALDAPTELKEPLAAMDREREETPGVAAWRREPIPRRGLRGRLLAGLAAAAVLAGVAGAIGYALAPRTPPAQAALIEFIAQPGTRIASFPARDGQRVAVAFHPGQTRGWVVASGLADPPEGRVYQLWVQPVGSKGVRPAATFVPRDGKVIAVTVLRERFQALAVSVEPPGGSGQPTTKPVFSVTI